ncbi:MAG: hypothetical protein HYY96_17920 [Candidatus Tectomicrobia bacterium]|nr:hypothetical protein [Candidatus Tectomicrobia bacterium]
MSWLLVFILMGIVFLYLQQRRAGHTLRASERSGESTATLNPGVVTGIGSKRAPARQAQEEVAAEEHVELVRISWEWPTCERCNQFQGKVYAAKGRSRIYQSLEELPGGGPPFHPECRHTLKPFSESEVTKEELERLRAGAPLRELTRDDQGQYRREKIERIRKVEYEQLRIAEAENNTSKVLRSLLRLVSRGAATAGDLKKLGDTYERLGKIYTALEAWKRARRLDRTLPGVEIKLKKYEQLEEKAPS